MNVAARTRNPPRAVGLLWCLPLLLGSLSAPAASFDCARASSASEQRICANAALGALDEALAAAYAAARQRTDVNADALRRQQRLWLNYRRDRCDDDACLARAYADRLAALARLPEQPAFSGLYRRVDAACFVANNAEGMACEGEAESSILIDPAGPDAAWVEASLWFFNGHSCSFGGAARWQQDHWVALHVESDSEISCRLALHADGDGLRSEASEDCRYFCGARGSLHQIELPRALP